MADSSVVPSPRTSSSLAPATTHSSIASSAASNPTGPASPPTKTPNFSRPRPTTAPSQPRIQHDRPDENARPNSRPSTTHSISAFHNPRNSAAYPKEPRFDDREDDSDDEDGGITPSSAAEEFTWDIESGTLKARASSSYPKEREHKNACGRRGILKNGANRESGEQHAAAARESSSASNGTTVVPSSVEASSPKHSVLKRSRSSRSAGGSSTMTTSSTRSLMEKLQVSTQKPKVLARVQKAERSNSVSTDGAEDTASHHTMSETRDRDSIAGEMGQADDPWRSSDFDTSGLSEKEKRKMQKKGINPSLYAEMKAAREGKWVGPLTGNTFLC